MARALRRVEERDEPSLAALSERASASLRGVFVRFRARNRETKASEYRCGRVLAVERDAPETGGGGGGGGGGGKKKTSSSREKASPPPGWTLVLDGGGEKGSGGATTRSPVSCVSNVACDEGEVRAWLARVADGDADAALATLEAGNDDDGGDAKSAPGTKRPAGDAGGGDAEGRSEEAAEGVRGKRPREERAA